VSLRELRVLDEPEVSLPELPLIPVVPVEPLPPLMPVEPLVPDVLWWVDVPLRALCVGCCVVSELLPMAPVSLPMLESAPGLDPEPMSEPVLPVSEPAPWESLDSELADPEALPVSLPALPALASLPLPPACWVLPG
jgi:hypothetical protein